MKELVGFTPAVVVFLCGGSYIALSDQAVPPALRLVVAVFTLGVATLVGLVVLVYRVTGRVPRGLTPRYLTGTRSPHRHSSSGSSGR